MIHWKFRDRWRINMSHKVRQKRTQFIRVFWVIQYESSITKFSVNHKNYEGNSKIEVFFDDVITGQDDVITFRFSLAFKISGWTIAGNKNFWIWTILIVSGISQRTPTFQISSSKKCYKSMQNPSTKPCFRVSRLLWIRWWGQIWPIQTYNDTHFIYVSRHSHREHHLKLLSMTSSIVVCIGPGEGATELDGGGFSDKVFSNWFGVGDFDSSITVSKVSDILFNASKEILKLILLLSVMT